VPTRRTAGRAIDTDIGEILGGVSSGQELAAMVTSVAAVTTELSWTHVCARRLDRHWLGAAKATSPAAVASTVCGTHAQVMSAAELAIGLRLSGATRQDVRHALWTEGSLVKTFGPRGTVHLLPTAELPTWVAALSAVPAANPAAALLTDEQTEQVVAAVAAAVRDAELTIDELSDAVVAGTGAWAGDPVMEAFGGKWPRWRQALPLAGLRGAVCFGAGRGRKVTYTSPPLGDPVEKDTALATVLERYLHAYGPATPQRFANWLAAPPAFAKAVFAAAADRLAEVRVDGEPAWVAAGDVAVPAEPPRGLLLLPYFDNYAYAVGNDRARLYPGPAGGRAKGNFQVLLVDGVVGGIWHQRRAGRRLSITVEAFTALRAGQRRLLDDQVSRVGEILEATPDLTLGPVPVGGHA
jgi:winged helix DNA-binding protein